MPSEVALMQLQHLPNSKLLMASLVYMYTVAAFATNATTRAASTEQMPALRLTHALSISSIVSAAAQGPSVQPFPPCFPLFPCSLFPYSLFPIPDPLFVQGSSFPSQLMLYRWYQHRGSLCHSCHHWRGSVCRGDAGSDAQRRG